MNTENSDSPTTGIPAKPLRRRVMSASLWTVVITLFSQGIRLVSNLILARLLFPEAFGLMALTNAILQGLEMFSDLGIGPSVIQAKDPHPRLLDTAWSLHAVRGMGLFVLALLLAYPAALWYGDKRLVFLVAAVGLVSAIRGLSSTRMYTLSKELRLRDIAQVEIASQLVFVLVSSFSAWVWPSVWALVFGGWAGALSYCLLTYLVTKAPWPTWCWDRDALRTITRFGRWVLVSTIFTYALGQGDRLILGSFMTFTQLGLYQIANVLARAVTQISSGVASRVLFPLYATVGRETTPELIRRITKLRLATMALLLPPSWVLTCAGDFVVRLLWDDRYQGAGWMVRVLSASTIFASLSAGPVYLARGEAWIGFANNVFNACVLIPAMIIGAHFWGTTGLVVAVGATQIPEYLFEIWTQRRYKVWIPWLDLLTLGASAVAIGGGMALRRFLGYGP